MAVNYKNDFPEAYYEWANILYVIAISKKDEKYYLEAFEKYQLAIKYRKNYPEAYFRWAIAQTFYAKLKNDKKCHTNILSILLQSLLLSIFNKNWDLAIKVANYQIHENWLELENYYDYYVLVSIFMIGLRVIKGERKLSKDDVSNLRMYRGISKEFDIVLNALIDNVPPDHESVDVPDEELDFWAAVILAREITLK